MTSVRRAELDWLITVPVDRALYFVRETISTGDAGTSFAGGELSRSLESRSASLCIELGIGPRIRAGLSPRRFCGLAVVPLVDGPAYADSCSSHDNQRNCRNQPLPHLVPSVGHYIDKRSKRNAG